MAVRNIWEDLRKEVVEGLKRDLPGDDPRCSRVNPNILATEPEPIDVETIDWDRVRVEFVEGPPPWERGKDRESGRGDNGSADVFDVCAWYESYHFRHGHWGIHFSEPCLVSLAQKFWIDGAAGSPEDAVKSSIVYLFLHEFFHYMTDNAAAVAEIVKDDFSLYSAYSWYVYGTTFSSGALEEALANRFLYGRTWRFCHLKRDYVRPILERGPPGYRDFLNYDGPAFWKGRRQLMSQILSGKSNPVSRPVEQVMEVIEPSSYRTGHKVPLWLHRSGRPTIRITNI